MYDNFQYNILNTTDAHTVPITTKMSYNSLNNTS